MPAAAQSGSPNQTGLPSSQTCLRAGGAAAGSRSAQSDPGVLPGEEASVPNADDVIGQVRAQETRVQQRNVGVTDRHDVAVQVGGTFGISRIDAHNMCPPQAQASIASMN